MKILVVEDNDILLKTILNVFSEEGFICESAADFHAAEEKINLYRYDVVIIDINLPGGSGLNLIQQIRKNKIDSGIIVISARNSLDNKVEGLEMGADDYLTKPFDMAELIARTRSVIRRRNFQGQSRIAVGELEIDTEDKSVYVKGTNINLTKTEFDILLFFISNPKRVLTRQSIAEHIMGDNMDMADSFDFIYSHIKNIRKKIKSAGAESPIRAAYGIGYKLDPE